MRKLLHPKLRQKAWKQSRSRKAKRVSHAKAATATAVAAATTVAHVRTRPIVRISPASCQLLKVQNLHLCQTHLQKEPQVRNHVNAVPATAMAATVATAAPVVKMASASRLKVKKPPQPPWMQHLHQNLLP